MSKEPLPEETEQSSRANRDGDSSSSFSLRFLLAAMALFAVSMCLITWVWPSWKPEQLQILFTMICAWCVATAGWLFIVLWRRRKIVQQLGALQHRIGGRYNNRKESDLSAAGEASIAFCIWIAAIALVIQLELDEKGPAYVWLQTAVLTAVYIWYESRALQGLLLRPGKWELYERGLRAPRVGIRSYGDIESTELVDDVPETLYVRFAENRQRPAILTIATEEESLEWLEWTLRRRMNEFREGSAAASAAASQSSELAPGADGRPSQFASDKAEPTGPQFSLRVVLLILLLYAVVFMFFAESVKDWDELQLLVFLAMISYWSLLTAFFVYRRWRKRGNSRIRGGRILHRLCDKDEKWFLIFVGSTLPVVGTVGAFVFSFQLADGIRMFPWQIVAIVALGFLPGCALGVSIVASSAWIEFRERGYVYGDELVEWPNVITSHWGDKRLLIVCYQDRKGRVRTNRLRIEKEALADVETLLESYLGGRHTAQAVVCEDVQETK